MSACFSFCEIGIDWRVEGLLTPSISPSNIYLMVLAGVGGTCRHLLCREELRMVLFQSSASSAQNWFIRKDTLY